MTYDNKNLCKQNKQLTDCNDGVEVPDLDNKEHICYTDPAGIDTVKALYDACVGDLLIGTDGITIVACQSKGYNDTIETLIKSMFKDECNKHEGIWDDIDDVTSDCYFCTAPNTIASDPNTCVCKQGYIDTDNNMDNGCESSAN